MNRRSFMLMPLVVPGAALALPHVRCENPIANFAGSCNVNWRVPQMVESRLAQIGNEYIKQFVAGIDIVASEAGATSLASTINLLLERPSIDIRVLSVAKLDELINRTDGGHSPPPNSNQVRVSVISLEAFASEMNLYRANLLPAMIELDSNLYLIERLTWHGWRIKSSKIVFESADLFAIGKRVRLKIDRSMWERIRFVCNATRKL